MTDKVIASLIAPPLIAGYKVFDVFGGELVFESDGTNVVCNFRGDINDRMMHDVNMPSYELDAWRSVYAEFDLKQMHNIHLQPADSDYRRDAHKLELDNVMLQISFDSGLANISITRNNNSVTEDWCKKNKGIVLSGIEKWLRIGVKYYVQKSIEHGPNIIDDTVPVD